MFAQPHPRDDPLSCRLSLQLPLPLSLYLLFLQLYLLPWSLYLQLWQLSQMVLGGLADGPGCRTVSVLTIYLTDYSSILLWD